MQRVIRRCFSDKNYYEKLAMYKPIIVSSIPHPGFPTTFMVASLPVLCGGFATAFFPQYNLFTSSVPDIALYTCLYSAVHTSFLAGVHIGFGSILYDPVIKNEDMRYTQLQLMYPFLAPVFTTMFVCTYWAFSYSHLKALYSLCGISFVYIGILVGDSFYADKRMTIPKWYKNLKVKSSLVALLGMGLLIFGVFMHPDATKPKTGLFYKMSKEIYEES